LCHKWQGICAVSRNHNLFSVNRLIWFLIWFDCYCLPFFVKMLIWKKKLKCAPPNLKSWIRPWKQVAKMMSCHAIIPTRIPRTFSVFIRPQSKIIFATSVLVFTRRTDLSSFQRSHWCPIHILLLPNLAPDSLFRCFLYRHILLIYSNF
jgi:hypothetical protein